MGEFERLLASARSGNHDSRAILINLARDLARAFAGGRLRAGWRVGAEPSDIAQSVARLVIDALDQFRGSTQGEFETWVHRIVRNRMADAWRAAGAQKRDVDRVAAGVDPALIASVSGRLGLDTPGTAAATHEHRRRLGRLLQKLSWEDQRILQLWASRSRWVDIGSEVGLPSGEAARKRFTRLLRDLSRHMAN